MRISDWSSDVCSSDLLPGPPDGRLPAGHQVDRLRHPGRPRLCAGRHHSRHAARHHRGLRDLLHVGRLAERDDPRPGGAHPHLPAQRPVLVQQGGSGMTTDTSVNRETKAIAGFLRSTPARVIKVAVLLAILLFVPPLIDDPYVTRIFISAMMLGVMAAIYDLMIGSAGLVNFGYAGFIAVGDRKSV